FSDSFSCHIAALTWRYLMVTGSAKTAQQADSPPAREHQSLSSVCPVPPGFFSPIPALILAT
ncbi:MAG: hypothetical protein WCE66_11800, partial [Azonexus sp.]